MAQVSDMAIAANPTGLAMRNEINNIFAALNSSNIGSSPPGSLANGSWWADNTSASLVSLKYYDGTDWIQFVKIDTTNNIFIFDGIEFQQSQENVNVVASGSTATFDLRDGSTFKYTTDQAVTFTFSNPPATGKNGGFKLFLFQDATGRTITWPASVKWPLGIAPSVSAANSKHVLVFETIDGGTIWTGTLAIEAYA